MLRWISTFEGTIICGLCLVLFLPMAVGFVLRVARDRQTPPEERAD